MKCAWCRRVKLNGQTRGFGFLIIDGKRYPLHGPCGEALVKRLGDPVK